MSGVATAVIVGTGAGLYGASQQAKAAKKAGEASSDASAYAADLQYQMYKENQANMAPWLTQGTSGVNTLGLLMGLSDTNQLAKDEIYNLQQKNEGNFDAEAYLAANPDVARDNVYATNPYQHYLDYGAKEGRTFTFKPGSGAEAANAVNSKYANIQNMLSNAGLSAGDLLKTKFTTEDFKNNIDPGYEWRKQEGINALAASGAASGNYGSGNMGTALVDYGQNLASNEYQNAYNRWMNSQDALYNRLSGISGSGQTQSNALATMGMNTASNMGNYAMQGANAQGQASIGAANAWAQGINNIANQANAGIGTYMNYQNQQNLIKLLGGG